MQSWISGSLSDDLLVTFYVIFFMLDSTFNHCVLDLKKKTLFSSSHYIQTMARGQGHSARA